MERGVGGGTVRGSILPGGLRVLTEEVPGVRSAAVGLWVGVGSRDERPEVAGAAHFLEHVLFKGTARRSGAQIAEEIDAVGGELNAFTSVEHTCYYAHVLDTDLPLGLDLVCDVLLGGLMAPEDVDTERSVVLEELARRDDDPDDLADEAFAAAALGGHPLGRPVLGTPESVTALSAPVLRRFHQQRYTAKRMVLAVAGNVAHRDTVAATRRAFGDRLVGEIAPAPPRAGRARLPRAQRLVLRTEDTEQAHLVLGVRGLDRHDERRQVLGVLDAALGGGMSSRLFQEVRERRGLAYSVYSSATCYADAGLLSVSAGCAPERLGEVVTVVAEVLADLARHGLSDAEVARAKGQLRGGLVLGTEDTPSRMTRLGKGELQHGEHRSLQQTLDDIEAVTADQVAELAANLLRRPICAALVGPYASVDELPAVLREVTS